MASSDQTQWHGGRVRSLRDLTPDIRLFEIEPSGGFVVPTAGSHIKVAVQIRGRPDVRSYSIVGPCDDGIYRIAVKLLKDTRGGSAYMWSLQQGAVLTIAPPANHFEITRGQPEYLLLAGGIGITPIYTIALALAQSETKFRLLYACRQKQDMALSGELRERIGGRLHEFIDADDARIDLVAEIASLAPGGELYVCGPIGMLEAAKHAWQQSGRPLDKLRFETFGNSGRFASVPFKVKIPKLGREVEVPHNQTILEALEASGIEAMFDCKKGECGLCAVKVLDFEGTIDHRDVFFSDVEKASNERLCACVSRVFGSSLTIDTGEGA